MASADDCPPPFASKEGTAARRAHMFRGLAALLATGFVVKILTFALNLLLARYVSAEEYGRGFYFTLYNSLALFLQKEGFRRAAMRLKDFSEQCRLLVYGVVGTAAVNVLCFWFLMPDESLAIAQQSAEEGTSIYARFLPGISRVSPLLLSWCLVGIATQLEAFLLEPFALYEQTRGRLDTRPLAEGIGRIFKTVALAVLVLVCGTQYTLACALAEFVYVLVTFSVYLQRVQIPETLTVADVLNPAVDREYVMVSKDEDVKSSECSASSSVTGSGDGPEQSRPRLRKGVITPLQLGKLMYRRGLPSFLQPSDFTEFELSAESSELARSMLVLSVQKLALAEGEKMLLVYLFPDPAVWGTFALVTNLGSLVLRLLFAPIEDLAFTFFSTSADANPNAGSGGAPGEVPLGADGSSAGTLTKASASGSNGSTTAKAERRRAGAASDRDIAAEEKLPPESTTTESETEGATIFATLLALQGGIGYLALLYGPPNAYLAVRLLYGPQWADVAANEAVLSLRLYCGFLFTASLNGILEAYTHARAPTTWLNRNVAYQFAISFLLGVSSLFLHKFFHWRAAAILGANTLCMGARVLRCVVFLLEKDELPRTLKVPISVRELVEVLTIWSCAAGSACLLVLTFGAVAAPVSLLPAANSNDLLLLVAKHGSVVGIALGMSALVSRRYLVRFSAHCRELVSAAKTKHD
ncbi:unnamed protein product [Amoebophrya sp. A120]|nr:unnamed protein product [Amoebophrya sp. A120]|eukprot:GSA120T00020266001.1